MRSKMLQLLLIYAVKISQILTSDRFGQLSSPSLFYSRLSATAHVSE